MTDQRQYLTLTPLMILALEVPAIHPVTSFALQLGIFVGDATLMDPVLGNDSKSQPCSKAMKPS